MSAVSQGAFWEQALGAPLALVTDFDGTVTLEDVGSLIWERLTPPSPDLIRRLVRGEAGSRIAYMETTARVNLEEALALADGVAVDPGFPALVRWAEAMGIPLAVLSDGFTFYIDRILRREGLAHLPVFANEWVGPGELAWPHGNPACDFCGCCKPAVLLRLKAAGTRIVYFGDGVTDLFAAGCADWVFARGELARYMAANRSPYFPLESFAEARALLSRHLDRFRNGSMEGRSTLGLHPRCQGRLPPSPQG